MIQLIFALPDFPNAPKTSYYRYAISNREFHQNPINHSDTDVKVHLQLYVKQNFSWIQMDGKNCPGSINENCPYRIFKKYLKQFWGHMKNYISHIK
jgi:hypothetical protein